VTAAAGGAALVITPTGGGGGGGSCDVNATTANFAAQVTATTAGQTLCLASGSYGTFSGTDKSSPGITIRPSDGASVTFGDLSFTTGDDWFTLDGTAGTLTVTGFDISGTANNITVKAMTATGYSEISTSSMNASSIVVDDVDFPLSDCPDGSCLEHEGRLSIVNGHASNLAGVTVRNSAFHDSCGDGIQFTVGDNAGRGVTVGPGNEFYDLQQGSCAPHVDAIQYVSGCCTTFTGNYIHDVTHAVVGYDGPANNVTFTQNVVSADGSDSFCLGGATGVTVEHNTFLSGTLTLCVNHDSDPTTGVVWRNNIQNMVPDVQGASTYSVNNYNWCTSGTCSGANSLNGAPAPSWVGGSSPTTYAGYELSSGTRGTGVASDATDIGVNP
jgi:hypothetical protein